MSISRKICTITEALPHQSQCFTKKATPPGCTQHLDRPGHLRIGIQSLLSAWEAADKLRLGLSDRRYPRIYRRSSMPLCAHGPCGGSLRTLLWASSFDWQLSEMPREEIGGQDIDTKFQHQLGMVMFARRPAVRTTLATLRILLPRMHGRVADAGGTAVQPLRV